MDGVTECALVLMLLVAAGAEAQTTSPPVGTDRALVLGPVSLYPSIAIKDAGFDSNIVNDADNPKSDFTFTTQPRLGAEVPFGPTRLTGAVTVGLVYYATYKSQQSLNRLYEARFEGTTSRVRPFVAAAFNHSRERSGYEIDARVLREDTSFSAGAEFKLTPVTSLTGSYRRLILRYGDDQQFLGVVLAQQLDQTSDVASVGTRVALTPLTTASVDVEWQRDRFVDSTLRDADSVRVMPAVTFAPDAVITGRIAAGYRNFTPLDPLVQPFSGFVGSANVAGTVLGATRFAVDAVRDIMYSFDPLSPNFLVNSVRLTVSQGIGGPFDVIGVAGRDALHYSVVQGLPLSGRTDTTRMVGGGAGYRMSPSLRFALIYDVTARRSTAIDQRAYNRHRLFGSVTYVL